MGYGGRKICFLTAESRAPGTVLLYYHIYITKTHGGNTHAYGEHIQTYWEHIKSYKGHIQTYEEHIQAYDAHIQHMLNIQNE